MSRNAAAAELQTLIEQIDAMALRAERLAIASGTLVDPKWFRGARASISMAAGDLDQKGLWQRAAQTTQEVTP